MHIPLKHGKENHQDHEPWWDLSSVRLGILLPERGQWMIYWIVEVRNQAGVMKIVPRSWCRQNGNIH
jgi:hypothetical protein